MIRNNFVKTLKTVKALQQQVNVESRKKQFKNILAPQLTTNKAKF